MRTLDLLFRQLPVWVLGAVLCMGGVTTAFAVDDLGLFSLDGNALDENALNALPDDWETLCVPVSVPGGPCTNFGPGPGPDASADVFTGIKPDPLNESIFTGGRKDIQDLDQWGHKSGSVPDKDEITNAYAAAYTNTVDTDLQDIGDLIIYFGSDRLDANGDAFMGFWFFQDEVTALPDGTFDGLHILGDILILANYPQSANAVPIIKVIEWDPSCSKAANNDPQPGECAAQNLRLLFSDVGVGAQCAPGVTDQLACAISNSEGGANDPTDSPWPYLSKDGDVNSFPFETFLSGGVNISQLLPESTGCFASFMAETRSSSSFTASLKDFSLDDFDLCGIAATKSCDATLNQAGDTVTVDFNGTVINNGAVALEVTLSDDMGDITAVCFDDGNTPGACGDGNTEPDPTDTLVINNGIAEFLLLGGKTVLFEGSYVEDDPIFDQDGKVTLTDEVTVTATLVGGTVNVVDDTADATCSVTGNPSIDVNKDCVAAVASNGIDLDVDISGTGSNDGQLKLINVLISDDQGATITQVRVDDDIPPDGTFDTVVTNGSFTLLPGQAFDYIGELTVPDPGTTTHTDTVTASGTNFFDQGGAKIEDTGTDTCSGATDPGIAITKECDVLLEAQADPARIVLKVEFDGVITNTGDVQLTNVSVMDDVAGDVSASLSKTTLAPGETATYSGSYYPSVGSGQQVPTASELSTQDTASASGTGALGAGTVNTGNNASGNEPAEETAECFLCDDDHDGIPDVLDPDSGPVME